MCWSGCRRFPRDTYGREIEVTCESHSNRIHLLANHGPRLGSDRKSTAGMPPMKQKIGIGTAELSERKMHRTKLFRKKIATFYSDRSYV